MFCNQCGTKLNEHDHFCSICGNPVRQDAAVHPAAKTGKDVSSVGLQLPHSALLAVSFYIAVLVQYS